MIPKNVPRTISNSARLSVKVSTFSLALFVVSAVLHRQKFIETGQFLVLSIVVFFLALVGALLAIGGFFSLWRHGSVGGKRSATAMIVSAVVLAPFMMAIYAALTLPHLSDISTDLTDPPALSGTVSSKLNAELQTRAYPLVTGRRYDITADRIVPLVEKLVADSGWQVLDKTGDIGQTGEIIIQAKVSTLVFGFTDFVAIRITDEGVTAFVDMRSRSGFGSYDLGTNAGRIVRFLSALDAALLSALAAQPGK